MSRKAFTLIELLVVIAIIAVLIGILLPSLGAARQNAKGTACAAMLHQIGLGVSLYQGDFDQRLPQALGPVGGGVNSVIGALFAGKKGQLPFYNINKMGAEGRPLNRYLISFTPPPDSGPDVCEVPQFKSPVDVGAANTGVPIPGLDKTDSMYNLIGASYTLNDHTLDGEDVTTLVPAGGGKMPYVMNTGKTWMIGTHPIYNFQQDSDRGEMWYSRNTVEANLLYVDYHAKARVRVPKGIVNTTDDYTFLP